MLRISNWCAIPSAQPREVSPPRKFPIERFGKQVRRGDHGKKTFELSNCYREHDLKISGYHQARIW